MVAARDEITLSISATGASTLYYEWQKDDEKIPIHKNLNIHGVYTPNFCIRHFLPQHEGSYKCIVSNKYGEVNSNSVLVKCLKIIKQPTSQLYVCGKSTSLNVVVSEEIAETTVLTYQWFKDNKLIKELPNCSGMNTPTLVITSLLPEHEGKYKCVINNKLESASALLSNSDKSKQCTSKV